MARWLRFRSLVVPIVVVLTLATSASVAIAVPGDLDPTFSGDGVAVTTFTGGGGTFNGVALDGRAPTGCGQGGGARVVIGVRREGGALDGSFSRDGRLRIDPLGTGESALQSCRYLGDGRLLGVGWIGSGDAARMLVARFTSRGRPDATFSGDGFVTLRFPSAPAAYGYGLAVQSNGRIVVVGETYDDSASPSTGDFAIARLLPNGRLDDTFSGDGRVTVPFGTWSDGAWKVAIDAGGRIVVAGWARDTVDGDYESAVAVLRPGGGLAGGFADAGRWVEDLRPGENENLNGLDIRHDDRIVIGTWFPESSGHAIVQLLPDGGYDGSFGGGDGKVEDVTPDTSLRDLEVSERRIVFAGEWTTGAVRFVRLRPRGNLDGTFGDAGVATLDLVDARIDDLTHDRDGRIVASGQYGNEPLLLRLRA
jgi:uncharacterized delta-60 repeat protein